MDSYFCEDFQNLDMKRILVVITILMFASACQEQAKIAFINNGDVINEYQEKKDLEEKFKVKDEAFKKKTDSISQAFQLEAQQFQLKAQKMSQKKAQEEYNALGQKQQLLQQQLQFEQQQMQQAFNTEIDSVIKKVKSFVKDYGKKNGYTYILGSNEAGSVMYGEETNDLSQTIIDALNASYKKE